MHQVIYLFFYLFIYVIIYYYKRFLQSHIDGHNFFEMGA
jgi:hypothetical protein